MFILSLMGQPDCVNLDTGLRVECPTMYTKYPKAEPVKPPVTQKQWHKFNREKVGI